MRRHLLYPAFGLTSGITLSSLAIAAAGHPAALLLRYEREPILTGQLWRLFSALAVHLGPGHLVMNLAVLWLLWAGFMRYLPETRWWAYVLFSTLGVTLGLLLFNPSIEWYVGLSGVLHGLVVAVLVEDYRNAPGTVLLLGMALLVKLGWEQYLGPLPASEAVSGGPVVVDAHLYGAIGGGIAGVTLSLWKRRNRS
ncbi:MAG TPA: rhombosortase [Chromatiales bacterium]|nr:rhombosortase [Chromatiales bacterium]